MGTAHRPLPSLFDNWSPELAWWYGAFLGDGNVWSKDGTYRVSLTGCASTSQRWLALVAPDKTPLEFKHSSGTFQAYVGSREIVAWLGARGIQGAKSHTLPWPTDIPPEVLRHFLRGLWDTDGSLFVEQRKRGRPATVASYACATLDFITRLRDALAAVFGLPEVAITPSRKGKFTTYGIKFSGSSGLKLARELYEGSPEHLRNEDRFEAYRRFVAAHEEADRPCACGEPATKKGQCAKCFYRDHKASKHSRTTPRYLKGVVALGDPEKVVVEPPPNGFRPGVAERFDPAKVDHSLYGTIELLGPLASS